MTITVVTDLGYGDAGKGTVTDWLSWQGSTLVTRHNGGPQAGHNVVTADGQHHTFSQFGAGTFAGASTYLSKFMLISPLNMLLEADHLWKLGEIDIWDRMYIDEDAMIVTPFHVALNRAQAGARGGSCGEGVGVAMQQDIERPDLTIRVKHLRNKALSRWLEDLRRHLYQQALAEEPGPEAVILRDYSLAADLASRYRGWVGFVEVVGEGFMRGALSKYENVVFEGAQGVLLDQDYGFHPYTTWSSTTHANALTVLKGAGYYGPVTRLGVTRAYMVRHGAGPMPTEDAGLTFPEPHNTTGLWQGAFRQGHLDVASLRYAVAVCGGVDQVAVTHVDRADSWRYCDSYTLMPAVGRTEFSAALGRSAPVPDLGYQRQLTDQMMTRGAALTSVDTDGLLAVINDRVGPVGLLSRGPTADDKQVMADV